MVQGLLNSHQQGLFSHPVEQHLHYIQKAEVLLSHQCSKISAMHHLDVTSGHAEIIYLLISEVNIM